MYVRTYRHLHSLRSQCPYSTRPSKNVMETIAKETMFQTAVVASVSVTETVMQTRTALVTWYVEGATAATFEIATTGKAYPTPDGIPAMTAA